jgi:hypothetical protein
LSHSLNDILPIFRVFFADLLVVYFFNIRHVGMHVFFGLEYMGKHQKSCYAHGMWIELGKKL